MNAIFPSSRPNISVRVIPKIPATMTGVGGIGVSKENGQWTITPDWSDLALIAPGILLDPTSKELWVHDPVTDVYNRMTLAGLGQALFWGSSTTSVLIGAGSKTFTTQTGKDWLPGMFIQAFSTAAPANFVIGQVTGYVGTELTINVLSTGGAGSHADWTIVQSTLPGSGPPGATGSASGLNYRFVAGFIGDPGSGNVGFDSATIASITLIRISDLDRNGVNLLNEIATWDDSTTLTSRAKIKVYDPNAPIKFVIATISGPLVDGGAFTIIPVTGPVGTTLPAVGNCQVEVYRTGDKGDTGPQGNDGTSAGGRFAWNTSTVASDPSSGNVKVNSTAPGGATQVFISETTLLGQNIAGVLATWDDSTQVGNKGVLTFQAANDPAKFAVYQVTGSITDNGTWVTVPVTGLAAGASFTGGEMTNVTFARTGDQGVTGMGGGDMLRALNLSDVVSTSEARANLGLGDTDAPIFNQVVVLAPAPTLNEHLARKDYADTKVPKTGGVAGQMTGDLYITNAGGTSLLVLMKSGSGQASGVVGQVPTSWRWHMALGDGAAEGGSDAGSDFAIQHYSDIGGILGGGPALHIKRSTGLMSIKGPPVNGSHAANKDYVDSVLGNVQYFTSRANFIAGVPTAATKDLVIITDDVEAATYEFKAAAVKSWFVTANSRRYELHVSSRTLTPEVFGATGSADGSPPTLPSDAVVAANTAAFSAMGLEVRQRKGNCNVSFKNNYYILAPSDATTGIMTLVDIQNVNFYYNGKGIYTNRDFTGPNYAPILYFLTDNCENIRFYSPKHYQTFTELTSGQMEPQRGQGIGIQHFVVDDNAREIHVYDCDLVGGCIGFQVGRGNQYDPLKRARCFSVTGTMDSVQDAIQFGDNGDHSDVDIRANNCGRTFSLINTNYHRIRVDCSNPGFASKISVGPTTSYTDRDNTTSDIEIFYRERWKVPGLSGYGSGGSPELVTLAFQPDTGSDGAPGFMRNIKLVFDVATSEVGGLTLPGIVGMAKVTAAGAVDAATRGYVLENITISGTVRNKTAGSLAFDLFNSADGNFSVEQVRDFKVQDLTIYGSTPAADVQFGNNPVQNGLVLRNIYSQGNLVLGTTRIGTLDMSENVVFANNRSTDAIVFAGVNDETHWRYLPNGEIEMTGFKDCVSGASTTFTLPKALRSANGILTAAFRSGFAGDFRTTIASTTSGTITRATGTVTYLAQWVVRGHIP
jgi:hypothetical protein